MVFFNPHQKSLSGVIPGVEIGSVVEYEYEYDYYNPEDPRLFSPGFQFQGAEPVMFSRAKVYVPAGTTYNYTTRNFPDPALAEPVVEEKDGVKSYCWTLENMPPIVPEPSMPPTEDVVAIMDSSVFKTHQEVYDLLRQLQSARLVATPQIEAAVKEITAGAQTVDDKIARIYHWVQEKTRYISIKGSLGAGFSGHTANETFENRYGDCTDKAMLFATMLKVVGVDSYPLIIQTNDAGTAITEIPNLSGNHCINEVCTGGRSFYLDTTAQDYRYPYFRSDDHGVFAINALRGDIKKIPVPDPKDNSRVSRLTVTLNAEGDAVVKTRNEYNGSVEAGVRGFWKSAREDSRPMLMSQYVNSISPGAILDSFTLSKLEDLAEPLVMTLDYQLPKHAIRTGKVMYLTMPTLEKSYQEVALETRKYPIQYMTTEERILEIDLTMPAGFKAKWLPPALEINNPYIAYSAKYEERDGHVVFHESFQRLQRIVPVKDYAVYRDALRSISDFSQKEIFLTEKD
jgi:transglutaminase-like putative cysteine protease